MSHEIDMSNDRANIAFKGEKPWHGLGQQLPTGNDINEWRKAAGLEWEAHRAPVFFKPNATARPEYLLQAPKRDVLFRNDTHGVLSIVSDRYQTVQPGEILEFFRDFVEKHGFEMDVAGSLREGKKIWALAKARDEMKLGKGDVTERHLLLATSYDLSLPTTIAQVATRVVCENTIQIGLAENGPKDSTKHSTTWNVDEQKSKIIFDKQWTIFNELAVQLADTKVSEAQARDYFMELFYPEPVRKLPAFSAKGAERRLAELGTILHAAPGQDLPSAKGTAWGLLNSITFYVDHACRSRSQDIRLDNAWFGTGANLKQRALVLARSMIKKA